MVGEFYLHIDPQQQCCTCSWSWIALWLGADWQSLVVAGPGLEVEIEQRLLAVAGQLRVGDFVRRRQVGVCLPMTQLHPAGEKRMKQ